MAKVIVKIPNEEMKITEIKGDNDTIFKEICRLCADEDEGGDCIVEAVHLAAPAYTFSFFVNENGMDLNLPLNFKMKTKNPIYPIQNILGTAVFFRGHIDGEELVFEDVQTEDIETVKQLLYGEQQKKADQKNMIVVNLPFDAESHSVGVGEGIWVSVSPEVKAKSNADIEDGVLYTGIAENDSVYYRDISHGDTVLFKLNGTQRAVADMDFLSDKRRISEQQLMLCKIYMALKGNNMNAAAALISSYEDKYGYVDQQKLREAGMLLEVRQ